MTVGAARVNGYGLEINLRYIRSRVQESSLFSRERVCGRAKALALLGRASRREIEREKESPLSGEG